MEALRQTELTLVYLQYPAGGTSAWFVIEVTSVLKFARENYVERVI